MQRGAEVAVTQGQGKAAMTDGQEGVAAMGVASPARAAEVGRHRRVHHPGPSV